MIAAVLLAVILRHPGEPRVYPRTPIMRVTASPLCSGRISPMQYGQFIEYLCDLVPSMWAEKLYDPSFEGLTPYKFVYIRETDFKEKPWYPFGQTTRLRVDQDTTSAIGGACSERIVLGEGANSEGGIAQDGISLNKGVACRFSIYVRGVNGTRMQVRLFHGTSVFGNLSFPVTDSWHKVAASFVPPATDSNVTIGITFRGPGAFWLDSASLMPSDAVGGWRKDVVKALKELKPGVVRIGGSVMDDAGLGTFEWKDTIGDPDRRAPFPAWGGQQTPGAGLEEVVQLIQSVGAEPLICVRYEQKTPRDAAEEVEYFNGSVGTPMETVENRVPAQRRSQFAKVWGLHAPDMSCAVPLGTFAGGFFEPFTGPKEPRCWFWTRSLGAGATRP